jgi:hypothetical protein
LIITTLKQKIDALAALAAVEQSGMDWGEIHTHRDSLDDVFVKLVSGKVDEHGEIIVENADKKSSNQRRR